MKNFEDDIKKSLNRSISKLSPNIRSSILNECSNINATKKRKRKYVSKIAYGIAISYMTFFLLINTIPASAQMLYKIPLIDKIVWNSVIDKGIFEAFDSGYTQPINELIADQNIKFTVHDVIVGNKIHFLMSVEFFSEIYEQSEIESINITATDQDGKNLSFTSSSPYYDKLSGTHIFNCSIVTFNGDAFKDINSINLRISNINFDDGTKLEGDWEIQVPIQIDDSTKDALWEKEINKDVFKEDGSTFLIEKVVSTPSDVAIHIKMDLKDSRNAPRKVFIVDSGGSKIPMINVLSQKNGDITEYKYYFDASYPNEPIKFGYSDGELIKEINLK